MAIIGLGCRFPGADGPAAFWRLLRDGRCAISEVPPDRWDWRAFQDDAAVAAGLRWGGFLERVEAFDPSFFGISPGEAEHMDPQQRLLLEVVYEALEDAGQDLARLAGTLTGVFVGVSINDYCNLLLGAPQLIGGHSATGAALSVTANRISYLFDLRGPSLMVDTACSSSLVAVHLACRALRSGEASLALAGGVNLMLSPIWSIALGRAGMLAPDGRCKTFDARANGYVRGEGAGFVVLKPLAAALADGDRVYAVIRGSATNQDGRTNGLTAPSRWAQETLLRAAYKDADLSPAAVRYVEAHGTGTLIGDPIETTALGAVRRAAGASETCAIGSVKTNVGHLESAAGIAGLIKVALALDRGLIPPSIHFEQPNPYIPFKSLGLRVQTCPAPWPEADGLAVAGVSSFGFGGANAHLALEAAPPGAGDGLVEGQPAGPHLLVLSARGAAALGSLAEAYSELLTSAAPDGPDRLADICYTAAARRTHHEHRLAIVGRDAAEIAERLSTYARRRQPGPGIFTGLVRAGQTDGGEVEALDDPPLDAAERYVRGGAVDWQRLFPRGGRCVSLPSYPWQRQRIWLQGAGSVADLLQPNGRRAPAAGTPSGAASSVEDARRYPRPDLPQAYVAPRSELERTLAGIWGRALGFERVGIRDSFFDLGGDSVVAARILALSEQTFGIRLSLRTAFEAATIEELAGALETALLAELEQLSDAEAERLLREQRPADPPA